jgi:hypothetical protein
VELLLQNGARQNEVDNVVDMHRQTSLARAIEGGSVAVVQLLLAQYPAIDYKYTIVSQLNMSLSD